MGARKHESYKHSILPAELACFVRLPVEESNVSDRRELTFTVEGMTCAHCALTVDEEVGRVSGVVEVSTSHEDGTSRVVIEGNTDAASVARAIESGGFGVVRIDPAPSPGVRAPHSNDTLDLLIIGAGSAGFAAAIRATELGASVGMVERGALGGTCVNVGCVPSKTLIRAAEVHHHAAHPAFDGIRTRTEQPNFRAVIGQKRELVKELQKVKYRDVLASYPAIKLLRGDARFRPDGTIEVDGERVCARKVLIVTGSSPHLAPVPGLADARPLTSTELMELERLPDHLVVLGGGYVGLELGQTFERLGSHVTVLARSRLLSREDVEISTGLATYLREEEIDVRTEVKLAEVSGEPGAFQIRFERDGKSEVIESDQLLAATGRRPNTRRMGLEEAGIRLGARGEVVVDEHLETSRPGVYAAGDVSGGPAFVYVAAYAGSLAAENALNGDRRTYDLSVVPRVTFTDPAVAAVGLTEAQARERGIDVAVSRLPMSYVPRAIAARDTRGLVKLVADAKTKRLVGAHILAPEAGDIIQQAAMAIRYGIRTDEIASMLHPYLTRAEAMKLACQTFEKDVAMLSCCAA